MGKGRARSDRSRGCRHPYLDSLYPAKGNLKRSRHHRLPWRRVLALVSMQTAIDARVEGPGPPKFALLKYGQKQRFTRAVMTSYISGVTLVKALKFIDAFPHRANQSGCFGLTISAGAERLGKLLV